MDLRALLKMGQTHGTAKVALIRGLDLKNTPAFDGHVHDSSA
jgi:hypothetical protein